jgi:vacuolar-type H+-ATPase subunit H
MHLRKKKTLMDQAAEFAEQIIPTLEAAVDTAKEKAGPMIEDAREQAAPLLAQGRAVASEKAAAALEKAGPIIEDAKVRASEAGAAGAAVAAEKAAYGRALADSKLRELKGEPEPKKRGFFKKLLLLGGLAAIAGVVAKKLTSSNDAGWQSSYTPAPAPTPAPGAPPTPASSTTPPPAGDPLTDPLSPDAANEPTRIGDDAAAAAPGEALSDAADAPHDSTTPDDPVETVQVNDDGDKKA